MTDRIVIAGASGFIGDHLARVFRAEGSDVKLIGRTGPDARWGETTRIRQLVDGADLVINMAGKSVNCRYDEANRREILRSRIETTRELGEAIAASDNPPPLWLNSSTATIYRHAEDHPQTESTGEIGQGFSVSIATTWEDEFFARELPGTRRVALRMAIVLGDGSALVPLINLARAGLGGPQLDGPWPSTAARREAGTYHAFGAAGGRQKFSWIHIDDMIGSLRWLRDHDEIEGVVNIASPNPVDNRTMMDVVRRAVGMPIGLPAFRWMLEIGMAVFRTESELVLKSRWIEPQRLVDGGYVFEHPHIEEAVGTIVAERRRRR